MIKLTKPNTIPNKLLTKGKNKALEHCNNFNTLALKYIKGEELFDFDSKIYGHDSVKDLLKTFQNNKCCFCESLVTDISHGDIEHFRPKSGYKNKKTDKVLQRPGYYWLVYDWSNLLFSCQICNQIYKKDFFPILNPRSRAKNHNDDITKEKPVFINPYEEDPKRHIGFRKEMPYGKTKRGEETIDYIGLDRNELNEIRLTYYKLLKTTYKIANASPNPLNGIEMSDIMEAQDLLKELTSNKGQYLSMVNTAIKDNFKVV